jgi:hypothetical protein
MINYTIIGYMDILGTIPSAGTSSSSSSSSSSSEAEASDSSYLVQPHQRKARRPPLVRYAPLTTLLL